MAVTLADELRVPALGWAYCDACGLLMPNGFCLHGRVVDALARAYESVHISGEGAMERYERWRA